MRQERSWREASTWSRAVAARWRRGCPRPERWSSIRQCNGSWFPSCLKQMCKPNVQIQCARVGLHLRLGGDGIAASKAECFLRNLQAGSGLLALVFALVHHANHFSHQLWIIAVLRCNCIGRPVVFHVVFQNCIENFIRRQRIAVRSEEHTSELQSRQYLVC